MQDNNHDHGSATHSMNCPVEGCDYKIEVHAHDDEMVVKLTMEAGKEHFAQVHPDAKGMTPEEMEKTTRESLKKLQ